MLDKWQAISKIIINPRPPDQNVFIFMQISEKNDQIIGWRPLVKSESATAFCD